MGLGSPSNTRLRIHGLIPPFLDVLSWYDNIWTALPLMVVILSHRSTDVISNMTVHLFELAVSG